MGRFEFLIQLRQIIARRHKQIAVETHEITCNGLVTNDPLDSVDCSGVTVRRELRAILAVPAFELVETIVEGVDEMRRRPAGLSTARRAIIDDDDVLTLFGQ